MDWLSMLKSEQEKKRLLERKEKADKWIKKNITPEVKTVLKDCHYGFDLYNGAYGSEVVLVNLILKLEKRIEKLESDV